MITHSSSKSTRFRSFSLTRNSHKWKNYPSVRVSERSDGLFIREATHLKLLTDRSFHDASQQMNTLLHQPQSQVWELTLDDNFPTSASKYFQFTINKILMPCYLPQSPTSFTYSVLGPSGYSKLRDTLRGIRGAWPPGTRFSPGVQKWRTAKAGGLCTMMILSVLIGRQMLKTKKYHHRTKEHAKYTKGDGMCCSCSR